MMRDDGVAKVEFYERILKTKSLWRRPIPVNVWRLLVDQCGRDSSFCHNIIPAFTDDGFVVLLVATHGRSAGGHEKEEKDRSDPSVHIEAEPQSCG